METKTAREREREREQERERERERGGGAMMHQNYISSGIKPLVLFRPDR